MGMELFELEKLKKSTVKRFLIFSQEKVFLYVQEMELYSPKIKTILIFCKKLFLHLGK